MEILSPPQTFRNTPPVPPRTAGIIRRFPIKTLIELLEAVHCHGERVVGVSADALRAELRRREHEGVAS